jgi:hypothetical protein
MGLRRDLAGAAEDGDRASIAGHRALGGELACGAAGGGGPPPGPITCRPGPRRCGSDRVGIWLLAAPGALVPASKPGQRGLGLVVWVSGVLRRGFAPGTRGCSAPRAPSSSTAWLAG